uniref:Uncharacterized protein n=1 Tax=Arundo donax TaxID=35708 RepID=A0A0A9CVN1_ARUDO
MRANHDQELAVNYLPAHHHLVMLKYTYRSKHVENSEPTSKEQSRLNCIRLCTQVVRNNFRRKIIPPSLQGSSLQRFNQTAE